jgi:hypothetical protein
MTCPTKTDKAEVSDIFLGFMARLRISCHDFKEEGNISVPIMIYSG